MINKQGLWFLTLFSLILVLSVYYITMPNDIFENEKIINNNDDNKKDNDKEKQEKIEEVNSLNTSYVETLKIELDSDRAEILDTLQQIINDDSKSVDEKNEAYEQMKEINDIKALEDSIAKKIKDKYSLDAYVKQEDLKVEIVIDEDEHDVSLANKIMRTVQDEFTDPMSISVKFS